MLVAAGADVNAWRRAERAPPYGLAWRLGRPTSASCRGARRAARGRAGRRADRALLRRRRTGRFCLSAKIRRAASWAPRAAEALHQAAADARARVGRVVLERGVRRPAGTSAAARRCTTQPVGPLRRRRSVARRRGADPARPARTAARGGSTATADPARLARWRRRCSRPPASRTSRRPAGAGSEPAGRVFHGDVQATSGPPSNAQRQSGPGEDAANCDLPRRRRAHLQLRLRDRRERDRARRAARPSWLLPNSPRSRSARRTETSRSPAGCQTPGRGGSGVADAVLPPDSPVGLPPSNGVRG